MTDMYTIRSCKGELLLYRSLCLLMVVRLIAVESLFDECSEAAEDSRHLCNSSHMC